MAINAEKLTKISVSGRTKNRKPNTKLFYDSTENLISSLVGAIIFKINRRANNNRTTEISTKLAMMNFQFLVSRCIFFQASDSDDSLMIWLVEYFKDHNFACFIRTVKLFFSIFFLFHVQLQRNISIISSSSRLTRFFILWDMYGLGSISRTRARTSSIVISQCKKTREVM